MGVIMSETVAILGASDKPNRFSNKAFHLLRSYGHTPVPVSPKLKELEGIPAFKTLSEVSQSQKPIDTLTMYVGPDTSTPLTQQILDLKPKRVIFNPGSENPDLAASLRKNGIQVIEDCTLVMLNSGTY